MITVSFPITKDDLPRGPRWDDEGACYEAALFAGSERGWYWQSVNELAFKKSYVGQTLYPHPPFHLSREPAPR